MINQGVHADGKSRAHQANAGNLEPLSPVFVLCKHRLSLPPNFAPRCVGALLMPGAAVYPSEVFAPQTPQSNLHGTRCLHTGWSPCCLRQTLKDLTLMKRSLRHPVTPHKTKPLVYTNVILVPKIRLVPLLCNLGGF